MYNLVKLIYIILLNIMLNNMSFNNYGTICCSILNITIILI